MLRPATPLSILFFVAFVLLLLSTLSTPVIQAIPLASFGGYNFGVLGYCGNGTCKGPVVGYNTDDIFPKTEESEFSLPSGARHSLSSILIVHPVAAFMTLICFSLAVAAHFHSPAHSPRYLLALLIFTFPTLLVSLLAFLVDILLFVPHMAWGGWIVLAATIIIVASGVVICAMRRTLVSRKARKRRIAENADMNGQTYYASRDAAAARDTLPKADSPPPMAAQETLSDKAGFASFDVQRPTDDMTPLNQRNPSLKTVSSSRTDGGDRMQPMRGPSNRGRQPVDQYGEPIPPMPNDPYMAQNGRGMGPPQNRGRGRGGYPPRGGFNPRGGYGPRGGGGGTRGPPPPGWNGNGRGMRGGPGPGPQNGRGAPPPGYNSEYVQNAPPRGYSPYEPHRSISPPDPMPMGQAIEMDQRNGVPSNSNYGLRESDGDVQGMLALQQGGGFPAQAPQRMPPGMMSPTSEYSHAEDHYVPARAGWNQAGANTSNQTLPTTSSNSRGLSPIMDSPIEQPAQLAGVVTANKRSSDYYEDVDPRFAEPSGANNAAAPPMPSSLMPGGANPFTAAAPHHGTGARNDPNSLTVQNAAIPRNESYESMPDGSRSPAASDISHFTSVSQRGVNPNWRPPPPTGNQGPPLPGQYAPYAPRRPPRQEDALLEANPDFSVPGAGIGRGRGRGGRGVGRGGGGMGGPGRLSPPGLQQQQGGALGNQGRYPGANAV